MAKRPAARRWTEMKRPDVDRALQTVITAHYLEAHGYHITCWGWGAQRTLNRPYPRCIDGCGDVALLQFSDGARCYRCALWQHLKKCPHGPGIVTRLSYTPTTTGQPNEEP